jgi:hypothetical protein
MTLLKFHFTEAAREEARCYFERFPMYQGQSTLASAVALTFQGISL